MPTAECLEEDLADSLEKRGHGYYRIFRRIDE